MYVIYEYYWRIPYNIRILPVTAPNCHGRIKKKKYIYHTFYMVETMCSLDQLSGLLSKKALQK